MKAFKIIVMVIDHRELGWEGVKREFESVSYPNDCIHPQIMEIQEVDIGEWSDEHPLNQLDSWKEEFDDLFTMPEPKEEQ